MDFVEKADIIMGKVDSIFYYFHDKDEMRNNAAENYFIAANKFKINKETKKAIKYYLKAANLSSESSECLKYLNAAYDSATDFDDKKKLYEKLVDYSNRTGNTDRATKAIEKFIIACIAEYRNDLVVELSTLLVDVYLGDGYSKDNYKNYIVLYSIKNNMSNETILRNAKLLSEISLKKSKFAAGDFNYMEILCYLAVQDIVSAQIKLQNYSHIMDDRQRVFCEKIILHTSNNDLESFENECSNKDKFIKLKPEETTMLLIIKRLIQNNEDDGVDLS